MTLLEWRTDRKLTQAAAAKKLGLAQSQISRIERGDVWPDRKTLAKIIAGTRGEVTANDFVEAA